MKWVALAVMLLAGAACVGLGAYLAWAFGGPGRVLGVGFIALGGCILYLLCTNNL